MTRRTAATDEAARHAGPYRQGIAATGLVFVAERIETQTELALRNVDAVLRAAGTSLARSHYAHHAKHETD